MHERTQQSGNWSVHQLSDLPFFYKYIYLTNNRSLFFTVNNISIKKINIWSEILHIVSNSHWFTEIPDWYIGIMPSLCLLFNNAWSHSVSKTNWKGIFPWQAVITFSWTFSCSYIFFFNQSAHLFTFRS
jgi:hypothetical protein